MKYIDIRPGEKIHELLISRDEARNTLDLGDFYVIQTAFPFWSTVNSSQDQRVPEEWEFKSCNNDRWLDVNRLSELIKEGEF